MEQTNFDLAIELIGQAVDDLLPVEDPENDKGRQAINSLLNAAEDGYVLVQYPKSQEYMEEDWFDEEAILRDAYAYFIPIKRVI